MALDTSPIDELIATRVDKLPADAVVDISDDARDRLVDIAVLYHLRNGDAQRQRYDNVHGERAWELTFAPATLAEIRRMRGVMLARAQRAFTPPEHRVKPTAIPRDARRQPLDGIPMSPDRIAGAHLVKAGFVHEEELTALARDEIGRLIVKHDAIPSWQMFLESMRPIGPGGRLQRIAVPDEEIRARPGYRDAVPPREDIIGGIAWFREKTSGRDDDDLQLQLFEDGLWDALRKTSHVDKGYASEIDTLAQCKRDLECTRGMLDREYRRGTPAETKASLWAKAERAIVRSWEALGHPEHPDKIHAVTMLAAASSLKDARGKENVSAAMARVTSAITRIDSRFAEIREKDSFNAKDRITLQHEIGLGETTMLNVRHAVIDAADDATNTPSLRASTAKDLKRLTHELRKLRIKPYRAAAIAMIAQLEELAPDEPATFFDQLLTMHALGKIQWLVSSIERVKMDIAISRGEIEYAVHAKAIRRIETTFGTEQTLRGRRVEKLNHVMEDLSGKLAATRSFFEKFAQTPPDEPRPKIENMIKEQWKTIDTTNAVQTISSWLPPAIITHATISLT